MHSRTRPYVTCWMMRETGVATRRLQHCFQRVCYLPTSLRSPDQPPYSRILSRSSPAMQQWSLPRRLLQRHHLWGCRAQSRTHHIRSLPVLRLGSGPRQAPPASTTADGGQLGEMPWFRARRTERGGAHPGHAGIVEDTNLLVEPSLGACRDSPLLNHDPVARASSLRPLQDGSIARDELRPIARPAHISMHTHNVKRLAAQRPV